MLVDDLRNSGYQGPLDERGHGKQEDDAPNRCEGTCPEPAEPDTKPIKFREWL